MFAVVVLGFYFALSSFMMFQNVGANAGHPLQDPVLFASSGGGDSSYDFGYDSNYDSGYDSNYDSGYDSNYDSGYDSNYDSNYDSSYDGHYTPSLSCGSVCELDSTQAYWSGYCASGTTCVPTSSTLGQCQIPACDTPGAECNYNKCYELTAPVNVVLEQYTGGETIHSYEIYSDWEPPTSSMWASYNYCIGEASFDCTRRYKLQISTVSDFSSTVHEETFTRTRSNWYSRGNTEAIDAVRENKEYFFRLCAEYEESNGGGWRSVCSQTKNFTKIPYPTGVVSGSVSRRDTEGGSATCQAGIPDGVLGSLELLPNTGGYNTSCSYTSSGGTATGYTCSIELDNVNYNPLPNQNFTLNMPDAVVPYGCAGTCGSSGSCSGILSGAFDTNSSTATSTTAALYTDIVSSLFYKVRNMSIYSKSAISSIFPNSHQPFDSTNDHSGDDFFLQGNSGSNFDGVGVVMSQGSQVAGLPSAPYSGLSGRGWSDENYTFSGRDPLTGTKYIDYITSKKSHTTISDLDDSTLTNASSGVFLLTGDLTLDADAATKLASKNIVLMTRGKIAIASDVDTGGSLALFASNIFVNDDVGIVHAILSADGIVLKSETSTNPSINKLYIRGNMSSTTAVNMGDRERLDTASRPSILIEFDADAYLDLIQSLSTTKSSYEQIQ